MKLLITGGAGFIGSHAVRAALRAGHQVTVLDDLSHGPKGMIVSATRDLEQFPELEEGNIADRDFVESALRRSEADAVMHFAALTDVAESVADPARYYRTNFTGTLSVLEAMRAVGVRKIVFSSTAAVYGEPHHSPIEDDHPRFPVSPYGASKLMAEVALDDFSAAYGIGYSILRYFNVAGANPESVIGEAHIPETHLIPRILEVAAGESPEIEIFGTDYPTQDGTCIRDYVHVEDVVSAHLLALDHLIPGSGDAYNLGSERGFSVREVIACCAKITGAKIPVREKPRRPGDPASLVASSAKIRDKLGWKRAYPDLESMIEHAWRWRQSRQYPLKKAA